MGSRLGSNDRFADAFQNAKSQKSESSNSANTAAIVQATMAAQAAADSAAVRAQEDAKNKNGGGGRDTAQ